MFASTVKFLQFLRKRTNTNPKRGPIHYRSPARMVWRVIRGMLPHKSCRGAAAMERLKVFEGIPAPYDKTKRAVIPAALKVLRTNPSRKFTRLGDLSSEMGWRHDELIGRLENKRKEKSAVFYARHKALNKLKAQVLSIEHHVSLQAVVPYISFFWLYVLRSFRELTFHYLLFFLCLSIYFNQALASSAKAIAPLNLQQFGH